ncbi:MAG: hypothetical protein HY847_11670 [Betaproteobacteria bacterium]|nr:hypothetical protein [Betaproteobacteria bacterium]
MKFALIGSLLAVSGSVLALGLGNVSGQPVLGQALLIEIPLLGIDEGVPAPECFKIRPPSAEIESGFVLRNAQIQIQTERNQAKLVLTSASAVREPIIEFGLAVGCGFGLSKDYLLLTSEPSKVALTLPAPSAKPATLPISEPPSAGTETVKPQKNESPATETAASLRIVTNSTLEMLARQRYPLQPKAREKFMRMMKQANPELANTDELIAAGSELRIPPGLPVRREPGSKPVSKATAARQPAPTSRPAASVLKPAKPNRDMLVLGHSGQKSAAELLSEAERLTALLVEQTNVQAAAADKLTQLEDSFKALQKHTNVLESRLNAIEAERQAEKLAPKPASFDFFELLLAILAGGAIGGLSLYFYNRIQSRRESLLHKASDETLSSGNRTKSGSSPDSLNLQYSDGLPWQQRNQASRHSVAQEASGSKDSASEKPEQTLKSPESVPQPSSPQNDFDFVSKL